MGDRNHVRLRLTTDCYCKNSEQLAAGRYLQLNACEASH